jgi:hypothetical protein
MVDAKSRTRVKRLLRGDFHPADIKDLFIYLRFHCDGRKTVQEIGHFSSHQNERDRGITTDSTVDWLYVAYFHLWRNGSPFDLQSMPPATTNYFKIAIDRIDPEFIHRMTGMRRCDAYKLINIIAERITQNADGTWAAPNDLTQSEKSLINCVSSVMVLKPAFEADLLCDEFIATLQSNELITEHELSDNGETIRTLVQLYAISIMHNCIIQIAPHLHLTIMLKAMPDLKNKQIAVFAPIRVRLQPVATPMFIANLDPSIHCHPDLLAQPDWRNLDIELASDQRLTLLR